MRRRRLSRSNTSGPRVREAQFQQAVPRDSLLPRHSLFQSVLPLRTVLLLPVYFPSGVLALGKETTTWTCSVIEMHTAIVMWPRFVQSYPVRAVAPVKEDAQTHLSRYRIINQTGLALFYWAGEAFSHQPKALFTVTFHSHQVGLQG